MTVLNESTSCEQRSFINRIIIAYKSFRLSYRRQKELIRGERDLLILAFTSALILFMANLPVQLAKSTSVVEVESHIYIGLIGFVSAFSVPLFLYFISWVLFVGFKAFGGLAEFYELRLALFWSLNVAAPIIIFNGILRGFFYYVSFIEYVSVILQIFVAWIISSMLVEAGKFKSNLPTFLVCVGIIALPLFFSTISGEEVKLASLT